MPRQQRSRETVARVLDAATRLFSAHGYHATTTNHVADEAGISIGSLYQYFPNKDALLVGVAERHLADASGELATIAADLRSRTPDLEDLCRTLVTAVADINHDDVLHALLWSAPRTAALDERLDELRQAIVDEVVWHLVRLGHVDGDRTRTRARILATSVEAAVHDPALIADPALVDELVALCTSYLELGEGP